MSKETTPVKTHGGLSSPHGITPPLDNGHDADSPEPESPLPHVPDPRPRVIADTWGLSCFTSTLGA